MITLNDQNIKEFEAAMSQENDKVIKHFEHELVSVRTGRAQAALVENIKVECYGSTPMRMLEVATISVPEARLIVIQPWDKGVLGDIEKAILSSDLGITPTNDGSKVLIRLPDMTTARREELVKVVGKRAEEARVGVRNVRKLFHNLIKDSEKDKAISEDHGRRLSDCLQKITDKYILKIDQMLAKKEVEIKTI